MSQCLLDCNKLTKDLLATMVSLRVFALHGFDNGSQYTHSEKYLLYITETSDRAPHLEFFAIYEREDHYAKRVCGKWVICDEAEFPSRELDF
jgi:hypothetical protein